MNLMKLNSCLYLDKAGQLAAGDDGRTGGPCGGPDLPDRRAPRGRWAARLQAGQGPKARALMERLARDLSATGSMSSCSATPARAGSRPRPNALTERGLVEMAYDMGLPLVATNDVYFPKSDDVRGA